jgi:CBS domain-containing protein/sporulation protein YlmC with PRC-barrel domain
MYLTRLLGRPVRDGRGTPFARVHDLLVRPSAHEPYPPVDAVIVRLQRRDLFIPWQQVAEYARTGVSLRSTRVSLEPFARRPGELLLAEDVLDHQLIDLNGRRVVRTSDIWLEEVNGRFRVVAVDVGFRALWGRILPRWLVPHPRPDVLLDWAQVEAVTPDFQSLRLSVAGRLARLHPVDLAHIVEDLSLPQGADLLEGLETELAAEVLQALDTERQVDLLAQMDVAHVPHVVQEMDPDEAADLLGDLRPEQAAAVLAEMEPEAAADVRSLMAYPDDTAGGLMTTSFVAVSPAMAASAAIAHFRTLPEAPEVIDVVFVTAAADDPRLVGTVSLRDLLLAPPERPVGELAQREVISARPDEPAQAAAHRMADYDLVALPVVDADGRLLGVVTIDDALDVLLPRAWRQRLPRVFR